MNDRRIECIHFIQLWNAEQIYRQIILQYACNAYIVIDNYFGNGTYIFKVYRRVCVFECVPALGLKI